MPRKVNIRFGQINFKINELLINLKYNILIGIGFVVFLKCHKEVIDKHQMKETLIPLIVKRVIFLCSTN